MTRSLLPIEPSGRAAASRRKRLASIVRRRILGLVDRRRVLYRWDGEDLGQSSAVNARRFSSIGDLAGTTLSIAPKSWFETLFAEKAVLWAVPDGDGLGACAWVVAGSDLKDWYVPLYPKDRLVYAVVASPDKRGGGIVPKLVREIIRRERAQEGRFYLDCMAWNRSARRAFEKAGFRAFALVGPFGRVRDIAAND